MLVSTKTVSEFITEINSQMSNNFDDVAMVSWINEVEQDIYSKHIEELESNMYTVTSLETAFYPIVLDIIIPDGMGKQIAFEDIRKVYVIKSGSSNPIEYSKTGIAHPCKFSYFKAENNGLGYYEPTAGDVVSVIYRAKPFLKTPEKVNEEYLNLPDAFLKIYRYYIFSQICFLNREFEEGNNWIVQYNAALEDFVIWYNKNKPTYGI